MLILVFTPLLLIDRYKHNKKLDRIIESYKEKSSKNSQLSANKSKFKGWDMNNSPYRQRKSGLTWGGGNIKAANATRGERKSFLK